MTKTPFKEMLTKNSLHLDRKPLEIVQVNLGKYCNQCCQHCHVEAGPHQKESNMTAKTVQQLMRLLNVSPSVHTIDLTGGAPELNPNFRALVSHCRKLNKIVIDRCNLSVFFEPDQQDTPQFLADHQVRVVASLPCYTEENVNKQRGKHVFEKSLKALRHLNELGYGKERSSLTLDLVYNPLGAYLPASQEKLEQDYKKSLKDNFGIHFNQLLTITNMPISRFLAQLKRENKEREYLDLLVKSFNRTAAEQVMCRNLVSISWDGKLYDCDFNQMLNLPIPHTSKTLWDLESLSTLNRGKIAFANHCYGCTAGAGSSCSGSLTR